MTLNKGFLKVLFDDGKNPKAIKTLLIHSICQLLSMAWPHLIWWTTATFYAEISFLLIQVSIIPLFGKKNQHKANIACMQFSSKTDLHKTTEICKLVNKFKQLWDVVSDGMAVRVHFFQIFFINLADPWQVIQTEQYWNKFAKAWHRYYRSSW